MKAQEEVDDISIINVVPKFNTISKPDTTIQIPSFFSSKVQESASVSSALLNALTATQPSLKVSGLEKRTVSLTNIQSLESKFNCHTYPWKPPLHGAVYKSCNFENICLTKKGDWRIFLDQKKALQIYDSLSSETINQANLYTQISGTNRKKFTPVKSRHLICHDRWEWACFTPIIEEPMALNDKTKEEFTEDFKWYKDPVLALTRTWIPANFGHALLEDLIPSFTMLKSLGAEADRPLFMDNFNDYSTLANPNQHTYISQVGRQKADRTAAEWISTVIKGEPLYICDNNLKDIPCSSKFKKEESDKIQACFSSLSYGAHSKMLFDGLADREGYLAMYKENIKEMWGLDNMQYKNIFKKDENTFLIAIQKKPTNLPHSDLIKNVEEIQQHLQSNQDVINTYLNGKKVQVMILELESLNLIDQFLFFMNEVDMYITTQGSASYYSFLMRKGTYLIYPPYCESGSNMCSDRNISFQRSMSHLVISSMLRYNAGMIECLNRRSGNKKVGILEGNEISGYGDCNLRVEPSLLLEQITSLL